MTFGAATDELLTRGIAAARAGDHRQARFYLDWVLRDGPTQRQLIDAWYWLSRVAEEPTEQRRWLEQVLSLTPIHADARRDLAILDGRLAADKVLDPHQRPAPAALGGDEVATTPARCPSCGGALAFSIHHQARACQFCGYREAGDSAGPVDEQDWFAMAPTARGHRWVIPSERRLRCQQCGATEIMPAAQVSGQCAFCASSHLLPVSDQAELIEPHGVVVFAFDQAMARARLDRWCAEQDGRPTPRGRPRPIYLPFWTYDVIGQVMWRRRVQPDAELGRFQGPPRIEEGTSAVSFDDLLVPASRSLPADLLARLTFDTSTPLAYAAELLTGWPAEIYTVPVTDASLAARERVVTHCRRQITDELTSDEETIELTVMPLDLSVTSYKLLLLPVWVASLRADGAEQPVVINGQDGTVAASARPNRLQRWLGWLSGE